MFFPTLPPFLSAGMSILSKLTRVPFGLRYAPGTFGPPYGLTELVIAMETVGFRSGVLKII